MGFIPHIKVLLCAPPPSGAVGGGYLYNQALSQYPEFYSHYVTSKALRTQLPLLLADHARAGDIITHVLLDSLYLATPADVTAAQEALRAHRRAELSWPQIGLLAHLLPSQNLQGRSSSAKMHAEATESILLSAFSFAVAPSYFAAGELVRLGLPATRVGVAYPAPIATPGNAPGAAWGKSRGAARGAHTALAGSPTPAGSPPVTFLSVGNWSERKNLTQLVPIFGALKQYDWHWHIVVGDAAQQDMLGRAAFTSKLHDTGVQDRVTIENQPTRARLHELYQVADCFIMAPLAETYGIVFAEALSYGCIVAAPNSAPFTEFLTPGHDSFLCQLHRTEEWIDAIKTVITHPEQRMFMQSNAPQASAARRTHQNTAYDFSAFLLGLSATGAPRVRASLLSPLSRP
ncbi:MAG: glycosyltransferase family 4 protein [Spirochaeta sp.]|nr:glycosyltransferase family 4 protein [Spirochaeta sp.]